jgi:iron complex outermembrane recepter protein
MFVSSMSACVCRKGTGVWYHKFGGYCVWRICAVEKGLQSIPLAVFAFCVFGLNDARAQTSQSTPPAEKQPAQLEAGTSLPPIVVKPLADKSPRAKSKEKRPAAAQPSQAASRSEGEMQQASERKSLTQLTPETGYVAKDTAAGAKIATPVNEIPQAVSVIGQQELRDHGVQKVDEALRYTAGAFSQPFGYDSRTDWVYIRGFDATQMGMYLNGLQLFQYAFAGITIDPFQVSRVEVLKGPASVLYGGSNAGGIINMVPKLANGEHIRYIEAGVDSYPNGYVAPDVGDKFSRDSDWSYRVVAKIRGGDTQTDYADNFRGLLAPSLLYQDARTKLQLYGSYQADGLRHTNGFFPYVGTVVPASYGYIPRSLYTNEPDLDKFEDQQASLGYNLEHTVNSNLTLLSSTRWINVHRTEYGPYVNDTSTADNVLSRINFGHDTYANLFETDNQAVLRFGTGPVAHTLVAGVDYKFYRIGQWQAVGLAPDLNPVSPVYTNTLPALFSPYLNETINMNQLGGYAQDQMKFGGGWILTLNSRYDAVWIGRDDHTASDMDYQRSDATFSGRAGLGYEFRNGVTPYVSASRLFQPQIGTDQNGLPVKPQTGEQYEAGFKYSPTFMPAIFTAAVFDLTRYNTLQFRSLPGGGFANEALGAVRSRGLELEGKANLTSNLKMTAAFTTLDLTITNDPDPTIIGKQPWLVPAAMGSLWLDYTFHEGWANGFGLGAGIRYQGSSYADNQNTLKVPGATLFDMTLHYDHANWGAKLAIKNVFDKTYAAGCQGAGDCSYGEGRVIQLVIHASF